MQTPYRNAIHAALRKAGIHELHYPVPIHLHACYTDLGSQPGDFPHAEAAATVVEVIRHTLRA